MSDGVKDSTMKLLSFTILLVGALLCACDKEESGGRENAAHSAATPVNSVAAQNTVTKGSNLAPEAISSRDQFHDAMRCATLYNVLSQNLKASQPHGASTYALESESNVARAEKLNQKLHISEEKMKNDLLSNLDRIKGFTTESQYNLELDYCSSRGYDHID